MNTQNITIEKLAELMNEQVWSKGDLKRIYLNDAGYNTKKMTTKTYIYEVGGDFKVSCFVDCPSQPYQWCQSQANEVIESTKELIEKLVFEFENPDKDFYEKKANEEADLELKKEQQNFLKHKEERIQGYKSDYNRAIIVKQKFAEQKLAFESLTDADKIEIEKIKLEMASILGQPGSSKQRKELGNILNKYPSEPIELNNWMEEATTFSSEESYADFKLNKTMLALKLA